jgi:hypothetical protein
MADTPHRFNMSETILQKELSRIEYVFVAFSTAFCYLPAMVSVALSAGVFIVPGKIGNCRLRRRARPPPRQAHH